MVTFSWNVQWVYVPLLKPHVQNSHQIRIARSERNERRGEVINGEGMRAYSGEGVRNCNGEGAVNSNEQQDAIRPGNFIFLMKLKESCARRGQGRARERERER